MPFNPMNPPDHSAARPALGYLYQCDWALLELARGSRFQPDARISLELYDDVGWGDGTPTELLQVKHHLSSERPLGDMDVDVWRTLKVWMDANDVSNPVQPLLTLVTTATARPGSAMAKLRPSNQEPDLAAALELLQEAASTSQSEATREARRQFLALDRTSRELLVARIRVLDGEPRIDDVEAHILAELRLALPSNHIEAAMQRLLGWWHRQAVDMLQHSGSSIGAIELHVFLEELRAGYERDNLPTYEELEIAQGDPMISGNMVFVHQLRWVAAPEKILETAVSDYYRAYAHTQRWYDEDLIGADELPRFEARLVDEWHRAFAFAVAELGANATEEAKQARGRDLLHITLDRLEPRIRERYREPFFSRGTHHRLADEKRVGWHPDFEAKLAELLLDRSA